MLTDDVRPVRSLAARILGTWALVSYVLRHDRGEEIFPLGTDPVGFISFTPGMRMSVQMSARDRAPFAARGLLIHGSETELAQAARGYLAYAGTYAVDEERSILSHVVEVSLFPNWAGTTQLRLANLDEPYLVLATPEGRDDGRRGARAFITWTRLTSE